MKTRAMATLVAALALCSAWLHGTALAQSEANLSEAQVSAALQRAERFLTTGQTERAYRALKPVVAALLSTRGETYRSYSQLVARMTMVSSTAVVRTKGRVAWEGVSPADPAAALREAETRMLEVLHPKTPEALGIPEQKAKAPTTWVARHGEALVALERYGDAYAELQPLLASKTLLEPEGLAALALAARETGHAEIEETARAQCCKLAKDRALQLCGEKPKRAK